MNNHPIGILDSGLGGLTVWKEIVVLLPHESTVYIGDSKNTPYGAKSAEEIYQLAKRSIEFLLTKKVKVVVAACNAITVSCIHRLRQAYPNLAIIGTVPAIKPAAEKTKNKRIGILATTRTVESEYQTQLINQFALNCTVFKHGTDELVPLIEKGKMHSREMVDVLTKELGVFQKADIDTLVLGCTHFPLLKEQMQKILGPQVTLIDSGEAIARRVKFLLEGKNSLADSKSPTHAFYTTGGVVIANTLLDDIITGDEEFQKVNLSSPT